jgi:hypothetical protein
MDTHSPPAVSDQSSRVDAGTLTDVRSPELEDGELRWANEILCKEPAPCAQAELDCQWKP